MIKGGKNKIAKNGTWNNATVSLAKSVTSPLGAKQDPAGLLAQVLRLPPWRTARSWGTASIEVKVPK